MMQSEEKLKASLLAFEAKRWVGILETGKNSGQLIEVFQRAVDGRASNEPWCMAFVQYCIKMTDQSFQELFPEESRGATKLFKSEHCLTVWNQSSPMQTSLPLKGSVCIWQKYDGTKPTSSGHAGIVVHLPKNGLIDVVEGNTSNLAGGDLAREGDGVYLKQYTVGNMNRGTLRFKGFLQAW